MNIKEIISHYQIPIQEICIDANPYPIFYQFISGKNFLLVSDQNIFPLFENKIATDQKLIFDAPKADISYVGQIEEKAKNCDLIVGFGSGTINDLCKLASFNLKIPYIIFASAPSMNGYASANASISIEGHKKSLPAHLPIAIFGDLEILNNAPQRLIKAGLGDSLCFSTCHFDWLLSHLILGTKFDDKIFELQKPFYQKLFFSEFKIENLLENLIVSGIGMYLAGGSYPASQAEHLIAHYIEIKYPEISHQSFHGEQIAVTTLTVAGIQEKILLQENLQVKSLIDLEYLEKIFMDKNLAHHCLDEVRLKLVSDDNLKNAIRNWSEIKQKLKAVFISKDNLEKISNQFNLPKIPQDIAIDKKIYDEAVINARLIRGRFTCLDIPN